MSTFRDILFYIVGFIGFLFLVSLVKFYLHRKKQIHKIMIIEYIIDSEKPQSTLNIHKELFKEKSLNYTNSLLEELESEEVINQIRLGSPGSNNKIWEYIDKQE